jgi:hypothetical protein
MGFPVLCSPPHGTFQTKTTAEMTAERECQAEFACGWNFGEGQAHFAPGWSFGEAQLEKANIRWDQLKSFYLSPDNHLLSPNE